tara:strand:+ start:1223 stop:2143 length:921 start_codon:yes stop_codon:yes gene_type:complete
MKKDAYDVYKAGMKVFNHVNIERTGTREVVPVDERKLLNLSFTCFKDPKTGIWYGIPMGENDDTGRPIFRRITITGRRMYYLENDEDAVEWSIIKRHPAVLSSMLQKGKPLLKIYDRKQEAKIKLSKIRRGAEAMDIALNKLLGNELLDFARTIGISPENNDLEVVAQLVAEKAQRDPDEFMNRYSDINRTVSEIINRARAVGLIAYKLDTGLVYKESYPLGSSDIAAIAHLKDNPKLLETINIESKERSKQDYGTEEPEIEIRKDKSTKQVELVGQVEEAKEIIDEDNAILSKISNTASTVAEEL